MLQRRIREPRTLGGKQSIDGLECFYLPIQRLLDLLRQDSSPILQRESFFACCGYRFVVYVQLALRGVVIIIADGVKGRLKMRVRQFQIDLDFLPGAVALGLCQRRFLAVR